MKINIDNYMGEKCFFENASYNCPALELFGYSTDKKLHSAIRREMKKSKNSWRLQNSTGNHKSPFGI